MGKIPPLAWEAIAGLFRSENCYSGQLFSDGFQQIADKSDIKFVALSGATGVPLITMDRGLLSIRETLAVPILMPFEFIAL